MQTNGYEGGNWESDTDGSWNALLSRAHWMRSCAWSNSFWRKSRNDMNVSCTSGEWENIHISTDEKGWEQPYPIPALYNQEGSTKSQPLPGEWRVWATYNIVQSLSHGWLCGPMDCSTRGCLVLRHLLDFSQTHIHSVNDAIQPSHALLLPSTPALNLSSISLFQWVSSLYQVAKVLEFQLQHLSFQWIFRVDFL